MKRIILILAALAAWTAAAATPNRTATEAYVTNKIAAAVAPLCTIEAARQMADAATNYTATAFGNAISRVSSSLTMAGVVTDYLINQSYRGGIRIRWSALNENDYTSYGYYGVTSGRGGVGEDWLWDATAANGVARRKDLPTIPTKISAFQNDAGYLTSYTETDPTVPQWAKAGTKPAYTASEVGATTPADVTAAIREQSLGGIWDEALQVWWTPVMSNGSLTYQATTNVNLNAEN